jgi:Integrase core domain
VWTPGETPVIDWGVQGGLHVFCAVLAWSRFRFVRFAADEKASTTLALLAECFEVLGGVPKVVLADRMGCLKGGVVANVVVPTPDYVRFAARYRFRADFCEAADPESKGIVETLVGYAKDDLMVPLELCDDRGRDLARGLARVNAAAAVRCAEVNAVVHSEVCAVPNDRLETERELLAALPSIRPEIGAKPTTRKVDKMSCIRFASGRYSVPNRLIGKTLAVLVDEQVRLLRVVEPVTGEIHAEHALVPPGETSIVDDHYGGPRPDHAPAGSTTHDGGGEGVPGGGAGRGGVPHRRRRSRRYQADHRDRRDPHPAGRARHRPAARRARAGDLVQPVARSRRSRHPRFRRCRTDSSPLPGKHSC